MEAVAIKPVKEIIILVGYLGDQIKERIGNNFNGIRVSYVENDRYSKTNNMYSIYLAENKIDSEMVFVSADVYLTARTCAAFIKNDEPNSILVDNDKKNFDSEDPVKITTNNGFITAIDKKLPLKRVNGIAVGMYKLSFQAAKKFFKITQSFIKEGKLNYGYIEPIKILLKTYKFTHYYIENEPWCDIDTQEDYKKTKIFLENSGVIQ